MSAPQGTPGDVRSRVWPSLQVLLVRRADAGKRPCRRGRPGLAEGACPSHTPAPGLRLCGGRVKAVARLGRSVGAVTGAWAPQMKRERSSEPPGKLAEARVVGAAPRF